MELEHQCIPSFSQTFSQLACSPPLSGGPSSKLQYQLKQARAILGPADFFGCVDNLDMLGPADVEVV